MSSSYDGWKTRSDMDDRTEGHRLDRFPRKESQWRNCSEHGWAEHKAYPGNPLVCVLCESEKHDARFNELMAFALGPRPEGE